MAEPRVVSACGGSAEVRPVRISSLHCGTNADIWIDGLTWTKWGANEADGAGIEHVNTCSPDCAAGNYTPYPVRVVLGAVSPEGTVFGSITITGYGKPETDQLPLG
ncbi:hypothetical protein [Nocardia alni]|uniref:hypothetical protein n=1 Tax=Nocardia alni TaxID=2815723 RepID=UPI001C23E733|nr:hypothetical protein [Nocardia alni]